MTAENESPNTVDDLIRAYYEFIKSLDLSKMKGHTEYYELLREEPTLKLMSRLNHSYYPKEGETQSDPFDVLFLSLTIVKYVKIKYVIISERNMPKAFRGLYTSECTMTKLKRNGTKLLREHSNSCKEKAFSYSMFTSFYVWEHPFLLKAQTYNDMDYGDIWEFGELVHEGNKYGDTSNFYILGYMIQQLGGQA